MAEENTAEQKLSVFVKRLLGSSAILYSLGIHRIATLIPRAMQVAEKRLMIDSTVNSLDRRLAKDKATPMLSTSKRHRTLLFLTVEMKLSKERSSARAS